MDNLALLYFSAELQPRATAARSAVLVIIIFVNVCRYHRHRRHLLLFLFCTTLLKVNVEISTFSGRSQGLPRGRNISSSTKGRIVLPL